MTSTVQLKLRGISIAGDLPEKWTQMNTENIAGDIFTKVISAVRNFFQNLISLFNEKLPPETRDEQIHHWFHVAIPYLIAAAVLITCLCCCRCLFSCFSAIIKGCFTIVLSFFRCLSSIITGCFKIVLSFFRFLGRCLCCGGRSAVKMMKAPGRATMRLPRSSFEANPRGYFLDLRGKPSDFVF